MRVDCLIYILHNVYVCTDRSHTRQPREVKWTRLTGKSRKYVTHSPFYMVVICSKNSFSVDGASKCLAADFPGSFRRRWNYIWRAVGAHARRVGSRIPPSLSDLTPGLRGAYRECHSLPPISLMLWRRWSKLTEVRRWRSVENIGGRKAWTGTEEGAEQWYFTPPNTYPVLGPHLQR